jgi:hypothetical protein
MSPQVPQNVLNCGTRNHALWSNPVCINQDVKVTPSPIKTIIKIININ